MWHKKSLMISGMLTLMLTLTLTQTVHACDDILDAIISRADTNCENMRRNTICYGYDSISADPHPDINSNAFQFNSPGNTAQVEHFQTIRTGAYDGQNWGIAILNAQANLPSGADNWMRIVMVGSVDLINNMPPLVPGIQVRINSSEGDDVRFRSSAVINSTNIIDNLSEGTIVEIVSGPVSGSGLDWWQVRYNGTTGYVAEQIDEDLDRNGIDERRLPILIPVDAPVDLADDDLMSAAQILTIETGSDDPRCSEAPPNGVLIHTPEGEGRVQLRLNEVSVDVGSTIYVSAVPNRQMTISLLEGSATVALDNSVRTLTDGQRVTVGLNGLVAQGAISNVTVIPQNELSRIYRLVPILDDRVPLPSGTPNPSVTEEAGPTQQVNAGTILLNDEQGYFVDDTNVEAVTYRYVSDGSPAYAEILSADFDTTLTLSTDFAGTDVIGFDDDGGEDLLSLLAFDTRPNEVVYITVRRFGGNALTGSFEILLDAGTPERQIDAGTIDLFDELSFTVLDDNISEVTYRYVSDGSPSYVEILSADFDTTLTISTDYAGNNVIEFDDDGGSGTLSRADFDTSPNTVIYFTIRRFGGSPLVGSFEIFVSYQPG